MTQVVAPIGLDPHWQTQLFASDQWGHLPRAGECRSSPEHDRLSPRAAYQELLYGRAVLLDIRPPAERATHGEIHPDLHLATGHRPDVPVIVLCEDGQASRITTESMRRSGREQVTDIEGGFHAWRDLGLPTA